MLSETKLRLAVSLPQASALVGYWAYLFFFLAALQLGYGLGTARKYTSEGGDISLRADTILEPSESC